jgi:hypothetical protein
MRRFVSGNKHKMLRGSLPVVAEWQDPVCQKTLLYCAESRALTGAVRAECDGVLRTARSGHLTPRYCDAAAGQIGRDLIETGPRRLW